MRNKPSLQHENLTISMMDDGRRFCATHFEGERLPMPSVVHCVTDQFTPKYTSPSAVAGFGRFGAARRAIRQVPPELLRRLHADFHAWQAQRKAHALEATHPQANEFHAKYLAAKALFEAEVAAAAEACGVSNHYVQEDEGELSVVARCQETGVYAEHTFREGQRAS